MARRYSPYYANEGRYGGVGQAVGNLGALFADMNDPSREIAADRAAWAARRDREDVIDTTQSRQGRGEIADMFAQFDPETYDPRQVLAAGVRNNAYDPNELGDLFMVASGNLPGMDDAQRAGAYVGTGQTISPDDAFSIPGRDTVANRNFGYDMDELRVEEQGKMDREMAGIRNKPLSRDQLMASLFMQDPELAAEARPALYGEGSGSGTDPSLQAGRWADLEADVDEAINLLAGDLGFEDAAAIPPDLRSKLLNDSMELVREGQMTPRNALSQVLPRYNVRAEDPTTLFNPGSWFSGPEVQYDEPAMAPQQPPSTGGPQPGMVEMSDDGVRYRFTGGDPADPNNWQQVD